MNLAAMAPRGLLLDFGAVISVSLFEQHRRTEEVLGLAPGSLAWLGPIDPATDPPWQRMQKGEISERDYWARRADELGRAAGEAGWDMARLLARLRHDEPDRAVRPQADALVRAAKAAGLKVGVLSNELELFYGAAFIERLSLRPLFDGFVDATRTGILKPDARAYAAACASLDLAPQEVLFVDDQFRNVEGAMRAGLAVHWFDLRDIAGNFAAIRARLRLAPP